MQMSVGDHKFERVIERHAAMQRPPGARVPHPKDIETIRSDIVDPREWSVEFFDDAIFRGRSKAL